MNLRTCKKCLRELPLEEFATYLNRKKVRLHRYQCLECHKKEWVAWKERTPGWWRPGTHGVTTEEFDKQQAAQGNVCAICATSPQQMCVDHDHETLKLRGLLCHHCNKAIGFMRDRPELLRKAAEYVENGGVWTIEKYVHKRRKPGRVRRPDSKHVV